MFFSRFLKMAAVAVLSSSFLIACSDDATTTSASGSGSLPSSVAGKSVTFTFGAGQSGAPFNDGDSVKVTFSSSGALFIDTNPSANDGDEISISSFTTNASGEYIWEDGAAGFKYFLSFTSDGSINELNVMDTADSFLGQFTPDSATSGGTDPCASGTAGQFCLTVTVATVSTKVGVFPTVPTDAEMEATVKTDYEQGGATVSGVSLTKTTDTATQVTYKADFTLTTMGFGVSYSVIYDYVQI